MATAVVPRRRMFARPTATTGFWSWISTVDHKKIGILYGVTAFIFFILGGLEAIAVRLQLARPDQQLFGTEEATADLYNQFFTMHGITTIINMRAPGMTLMRMPVFIWMSLVTSFLLLFAMPIIAVALFLLTFDRLFGGVFFDPAAGGDPLLWQHLFLLFGHPEVYILILPAMGIVSEIIPVFSRKPLFGFPVVVFSGIAIGFMGWGVWVHHMFVTGLGP